MGEQLDPFQSMERELAKRHVTHFTRWTFPRYVSDPFHWLVGDRLTAVVDGEIDALMVFAPPQVGKSELCSVRTPAFWMAKHPEEPVILASYEAELAQARSKEARALVGSDEFADIFPGLEIDPSKASGGLWKLLNHRAQMRAAGIGGGLTGHGAGIGIIDDPVKNWKDALSPTYRETAWSWYLSSFRTRLAERGRRIVVATRWNYDDLPGRILKSEGAWPHGKWHVLRIPALAETQEERDENNRLMGLPTGEPDPLGREPGESVAPRRFSRQTLEATRDDVGPSVWAALFQGTPRPNEGRLFNVDKVEYVDVEPSGVRWVRYWDFAASTKKSADRASGAKVGIKDGRTIIGSMRYGRFGPGVLEREVVQTAETDGRRVPIVIEREPGSAGELLVKSMVRLMQGYVVNGDPVSGDKVLRAHPFAAQMEAGNVTFVRASWNGPVLDEMAVAPFGEHDDLWDPIVGGYNRLTRRPASKRRAIDLWAEKPETNAGADPEREAEERRRGEEAEKMLREYETR